MTFLSVLFLLFTSTSSYSQTPPWLWAKQAHTPGKELAWDVYCDPASGNVYVGGSFDTNLSGFYGLGFLLSNGGLDGLLAKYDALGNVLWANKIGGPGADEIKTVCVDPTGNVYVAGYFNGTVDFDPGLGIANLTAVGGQDGFLAKYTSAGAYVWAVKFGGAGTDEASNIYADASGVYMTGYYGSPASFYSTNASTSAAAAAQAGSNMFGVKYNASGVVQWNISGGSASTDQGYDVIADASNVYFTGVSSDSMRVYDKTAALVHTMPNSNPGNDAVFVIAVNQAGTYLWSTDASGDDVTEVRGITEDANNLYITGSYGGNVNFPNPTPLFQLSASAATDFYLAKISKSTGTFQWVKTEPGANGQNEQGEAVYADPGGSIYVTGYFNKSLDFSSDGGPVITAFQKSDIFLASYTANGTFQWVNQAGEKGDDIPHGLSSDNAGSIYVGGEYAGNAVFGSTTLVKDSPTNLFIAKIGCSPLANNTIAAAQTICSGSVPSPLTGTLPTGGSGAFVYSWEQSPDNATWVAASGTNNTQNYAPPALTVNTYYHRKVSSTSCTAGITSTSPSILITVNAKPSKAFAGNDTSLCASSSTVFAAATPTTGTGAWTLYTGAGVPGGNLPRSAVTGLGTGKNQFIWTVSNGVCPASKDTVAISVYQTPTKAYAGKDTTICGTSSVFAAATPTVGTGAWTLYTGAGIPGGNLPRSTVSALGAGQDKFIWTVSNGNCPVSRDTMMFTVYKTPSKAFAGNDTSLCASNSTVFAAATPTTGTGAWTLYTGAGVPGGNLPRSPVTALGTGKNQFIWTVSNGVCPASKDTVAISVYQTPTKAYAGKDTTICGTSSVFAAATPTVGTGAWTLYTGTGIPGGNLPRSTVSGLGAGNDQFIWTVSNGNCPVSRDTMMFTVYKTPSKAFAGNDTTICGTASHFAAATPTVGTGAWTLYTGAGIPGGNLPHSAVTALGYGQDKFIWTVSNGNCPVSRDTMMFTAQQAPGIAFAGNDTTICGTSSVFAAATPTVGTGTWTLYTGAGIPGGNLPRSTVTALGAGQDKFIWTVSNGVCPVSRDTMMFTIYKTPSKAFAGNDTTVCSTSSHFAAATPSVGTGAWTLYTGAGVPAGNLPRSAVNALGIGQDKFIWTVSNGVCPVSRDTMMFTVKAAPSPAFAGNDTSICGSSTVLNATAPLVGTGSWSLYTGAGTFNSAQAHSPVTALNPGKDQFIWTVTNGSCPPSRDTVAITAWQVPSKAFAGNDTTICSTSSHFAAATPSVGTGAWTLYTGTGIPAGNLPRSAVNGLGIGQDKFIWTVSNGVCPVSRDTMMFTVQQLPSKAFAGNDTSICGSATNLNASIPVIGTGVWSLYTGGGTFNSSQPKSPVTALNPGKDQFIWTVTNGSCPPSRDTVAITAYQMPSQAFAGNDTSVCSTSSHFAAATPSVGTGAWTLYTGAGIPAGNLPRSAVNGLGTGQDKFIWTVSNGVCPVSRDTMMFTVQQIPGPAYAGRDTGICGSATHLNASTPLVGTGSWSLYTGAGTFNSSQPKSSVTALNPGKDQFIWTVTNGSCPPSRDTVTITAYQMPSQAFAGNDTTICGPSTHFAATTPVVGTGSWSVYSGTGNPAANIPRSLVTGLGIGQDKFIWTVSNGVCPASKDTVMITSQTAPSPAFAGNDTSVCASSALFSATPPASGTGSWSLYTGSGTFNSTQANSTVTGLAAGKNQFIWTVSGGACPATTDTLTIIRYQAPAPANAGNDTSICGFSSHFCAATPPYGTGSWTVYTGTGTIGGNAPFATVSGLSAGPNRFIWTVRNGVCPLSRDTVQITAAPPSPQAIAGTDQFICGTSTTLNGNIPPYGVGFWSLDTGAGILTNPLNPASGVNGLQYGKNTFTWTIQNGGCPPSMATVNVFAFSSAVTANAGPDAYVSAPSAVLGAVTPPFGVGTWTVVSGTAVFSDIHDPHSAVTGLQPGQTVLLWTVSNGPCATGSDEMIVTMGDFIIPNAFSPNGDGVNDMFEISGLESYSGIQLNVFNRWGNEVYASDDYKNNWGGLNKNGDELAEDTYYYILKQKGRDAFKGFVILKRK